MSTANLRNIKFPLPEEFFPTPHLTPRQIDAYEAQMQRTVRSALIEYERHETMGALPSYRAPWSVVSRVDGLTAVHRDTPSGPSSDQCRVFGRITGDYRDFIDFYYAETSKQLFEWNKFMFGHAVDAAVLANIHTVDAKKPHLYMGIKWTCMQPSAFARRRDNCFLEYLIYTKDLRGRDVGVRVTMPLEISECPDLSSLLRVKRVKSHHVTIVRPATDQPGATHFFMMSENDFAGFRVSSRLYKRYMNIIKNMALFVDSKRISKRGIVSRKNWVAKESRRRCGICSRGFGATRRKHHCRLCGDVFCKRCTIVREIPRNLRRMGKQRTFKVVKRKFCKVCVTSMRESESVAMVPPRKATERATGEHVNAHDHSERYHGYDSQNRQRGSNRVSVASSSEWSESGSEWSETDSECSRTVSFCSSRFSDFTETARSSWSTTHSDDTMETMSFVSALDLIDPDTAVLEEEPSGSAMLEIAEEIDTTDMVPASQLIMRRTLAPPVASRDRSEQKQRYRHTTASGGVSHFNCRRGKPANIAGPRNSSRSLDQCLAEQEELLRQMVLAATVARPSATTKNRASTTTEFDSSASAITAAASRRALPKVTLYEG